MAHLPGRSRKTETVTDSLEPSKVPYQDNNAPYSHDDDNVTADYATEQEYQSYDDPDSVADILRDKFEQFYVGTREARPTVAMVTLTGPQLAAGAMIATAGVSLRGWTYYTPVPATAAALNVYDRPTPGGTPVIVVGTPTAAHTATFPVPVSFGSGMAVQAAPGTVTDGMTLTLYIERRV